MIVAKKPSESFRHLRKTRPPHHSFSVEAGRMKEHNPVDAARRLGRLAFGCLALGGAMASMPGCATSIHFGTTIGLANPNDTRGRRQSRSELDTSK